MKGIELVKTKKDHYKLVINNLVVIGEQERSIFRQIMQSIDNGIDN